MGRVIQIGKLDKRITFLTNHGEEEDVIGYTTNEKTVFKKVWATVKPIRGKEYWEAKKLQEELIYKITIRYCKGITTDMEIQYKEKLLEINSIINVEEANVMLELQCTEKVKHG